MVLLNFETLRMHMMLAIYYISIYMSQLKNIIFHQEVHELRELSDVKLLHLMREASMNLLVIEDEAANCFT